MSQVSVLVRSAIAVGVVGMLTSCQSRADTRQYELRGQILAVRSEANEVLIKHGDILEFMPGMTMPFKVHDAALLSGKTAGDLVTATLMVGEREAWLTSLDKTGTAPLADGPTMPLGTFVEPLRPGDDAPVETVLVDHEAQEISLAKWRGSAIVVTFIYLRCPLPEFCPLMDRRFGAIQRAVHDSPALNGRTRLLSVSFDPDADTTPRLKAHADKLDTDPAIWRLATASRETVDGFAARFGVHVSREADHTITHNLRTAVIGPDGKIVQIYNGSDWTPAQVVEDLRRALAR